MTDKRQLNRAPSSNRIELIHQDGTHEGRLENISLNGALVRLEGKARLGAADPCLLRIRAGEEPAGGADLQLICEVVHAGGELVGVRFTGTDEETTARLLPLMKRVRQAGEARSADLERLRGYLSDFCRIR